MISVINKPFYNDFLELCSCAENSIKLCSPFVKADIIYDIISAKKPNATIDLVTNVNLMSFCRKASDLDALQNILAINQNVYTYSGLHAKFYIFDNQKCIITSANLTSSGLKRNYEYGIITDDKLLVETSANDYNNLCLSELAGKINHSHTMQINKILSEINPLPQQVLPKLDLSNADEIYDKDKQIILNNLSGWKRDVFVELDKLTIEIFTTEVFKKMEVNLKIKHPDNENIEPKIRQILQQLRDLGLIKFIDRGIYKKLWI